MSVGVDVERDVVLGRVGTVLVNLGGGCIVVAWRIGVFERCVLRILLLLLRQAGIVLHRRIRAAADEREEHHEREQPRGQLFFHIGPPVVIFSIIARPRAKIQHVRRLTLRAVVSTIGETTGKSEWIKKQRR